MRRKRAISLVELLAVMSGCSLVLGLTASLVHQAMRSQSQTRYFFDVERNAQRLSRQFRIDVHGAVEASLNANFTDEGGEFRLRFPDGETVTYRREAEKIVRVVTSPPGEPRAREEYSFGAALTLEMTEVDNPPGWKLSVVAVPPSPSKNAPPASANIRAAPVRLQVLATLGRDLRFMPATEAPEDSL